jgi:hypothetical protein
MEQVIADVTADQLSVGEAVQPALSTEQVAQVSQEALAHLGMAIPPDLKKLLSRAGGIDYNGVVIYGGNQSPDRPGPGGFWQGLITTNEMWQHEGLRDWLVIGETDMDLLTVDPNGGASVLRDKVSHDINERFASPSQMIAEVLRRRL